MHAHNPADLDLLAVPCIHNRGAAGQDSLIDPDVGELSVRSVLQLEGQRHDRLGRVAVQQHRGLVVVHVQRLILNVGGAGEDSVHGVQQGLNALVLVRGAHEDGSDFTLQRSPADRVQDHLIPDFPLLEDRFRQLVRKHGSGIDQFIPL